jgi:hypothetical protein
MACLFQMIFRCAERLRASELQALQAQVPLERASLEQQEAHPPSALLGRGEPERPALVQELKPEPRQACLLRAVWPEQGQEREPVRACFPWMEGPAQAQEREPGLPSSGPQGPEPSA